MCLLPKLYVRLGWELKSPYTHMGGAVLAGVTTDICCAPVRRCSAGLCLVLVKSALRAVQVWVVKTRMQTQGLKGRQMRYTGVLPSLALIFKEEGLRGLYKGLYVAVH